MKASLVLFPGVSPGQRAPAPPRPEDAVCRPRGGATRRGAQRDRLLHPPGFRGGRVFWCCLRVPGAQTRLWWVSRPWRAECVTRTHTCGPRAFVPQLPRKVPSRNAVSRGCRFWRQTVSERDTLCPTFVPDQGRGPWCEARGPVPALPPVERALSWPGAPVASLSVRRDSLACGSANRTARLTAGALSGRGYLIGSGDRADKPPTNSYILS